MEIFILLLVIAWKADVFNFSYVDELQFRMLKINMKDWFVIIGILVGYVYIFLCRSCLFICSSKTANLS